MLRVTASVTGSEPIDVATAKSHLRVLNSFDDAYIGNLIIAVRELFERLCRRAIVPQNQTVTYNGFPGGNLPWWEGVKQGAMSMFGADFISIPNPPTLTIVEVATYGLDNARSVYDASNYFVDSSDADQLTRIILNIGSVWPVNLRNQAAVEVLTTSGFGAGTCPAGIKQAMLMMVGFLYNNRGACDEAAATTCGAMGWLRPYTVMEIGMHNADSRRRGGLGSMFENA